MLAALVLLVQETWAEDPSLKQAVAFTIDARGRIYVLEAPAEAPHAEGAFDPELQRRRRAEPGIGVARVRRYEDADGDGRAEGGLFADGLPAWSGGGIQARGDEVWVATDPSVWALRDANGDGKADASKPLFDGFGARLSGTGLRGPAQGPDGKMYFCSGERGFRVVSLEGERLEYPDLGAVLRCDVDGSNLEVYAIGLSSPGRPVFNDDGELFTLDGDRWIHIPEGADLGGRAGAPSRPEGLHVLPPVAVFPQTVSIPFPQLKNGRVYVQGTEGECSFALKSKGAGFELDDRAPESWPGAAEVDLDGRSYFLDAARGRITRSAAAAGGVASPLRNGLKERTLDDLAGLMGHGDRRVRQAAQQELVGRQGSTRTLTEAARNSANRMARMHAIWGLGQLFTRNQLFPLLKDKDVEIRAQTARVLGDRRVGDAHDPLVQALKDESPRVRRYAATALGKLGRREDGKVLAALLRENDGKDPVLAHAGAHALALIGGGGLLQELAKDPSPAVRAGVLTAMRRLARPDVGAFLDDPAHALDAARAIHDLPIQAVLPRLAAKLGKTGFPEAALSRALNANVRLGQAEPVAAFAANPGAPEALRLEALRALASWARPAPRDPVTGQWRPLSERDPAPAREALGKVLDVLRKDASAAVRAEAERTSAALP